jgi:hypothetical protein
MPLIRGHFPVVFAANSLHRNALQKCPVKPKTGGAKTGGAEKSARTQVGSGTTLVRSSITQMTKSAAGSSMMEPRSRTYRRLLNRELALVLSTIENSLPDYLFKSR